MVAQAFSEERGNFAMTSLKTLTCYPAELGIIQAVIQEYQHKAVTKKAQQACASQIISFINTYLRRHGILHKKRTLTRIETSFHCETLNLLINFHYEEEEKK
jgi:hypothetical protein